MSSIHNSTKMLFNEAFSRYQEALLNGEPERSARFRNVIEEVFNNTIDDNAKLLKELNAKKGVDNGRALEDRISHYC